MIDDVMPLHVSISDLGLRLALTIAAGALIGYDRGRRGHNVGLRTTMLVALAAAVSMIQANLLLPLGGKLPTSFAVMDLMRLPLGILTGVGFIGGGAILRRGDLVTGVTTAATLWMVTVIGLCLGGGQLILGCSATALSVAILRSLKQLETRLSLRRKAALVVRTTGETPLPDLTLHLAPRYRDLKFIRFTRAERGRLFEFELCWMSSDENAEATQILESLRGAVEIESFDLMARPTQQN